MAYQCNGLSDNKLWSPKAHLRSRIYRGSRSNDPHPLAALSDFRIATQPRHTHPARGQHGSGTNGQKLRGHQKEKMHRREIPLPPRHRTSENAYTKDTIKQTVRRYIHEVAQSNTVQNAQREPYNTCPLPSRRGECGSIQNHNQTLGQRAQNSTHKCGSIQIVHNHRYDTAHKAHLTEQKSSTAGRLPKGEGAIGVPGIICSCDQVNPESGS